MTRYSVLSCIYDKILWHFPSPPLAPSDFLSAGTIESVLLNRYLHHNVCCNREALGSECLLFFWCFGTDSDSDVYVVATPTLRRNATSKEPYIRQRAQRAQLLLESHWQPDAEAVCI